MIFRNLSKEAGLDLLNPMKIQYLLSIAAIGLFAGSATLSAQDQPPAPPEKPAPGDHPGKPPGGHFGKWGKPPGHFGGFRKAEPGDRPPGEMFGRMLRLTDEQRAKVKEIMEAQKPKIEAIREEQRAKMKAVFAEIDKEIRPILTPEQVAVLDNAKKLRESEAALRESQKGTAEKSEKK